jgi:calcium-dependent protein kinase
MGCGVTKQAENQSIIAKKSQSQTKIKKSKITDVDSEEKAKFEAGQLAIGSHGKVKENYAMSVKLGQGIRSFVRLAVHKASGQKRAIKTIEKKRLHDEDLRTQFLNEISILRMMDHPNIVKLHEFYEDEVSFYIVTEFVPGGELFDYIVNSGSISEVIAAQFMQQILSAVAYCHDNNIIHRDIKPENLLLDRRGPEAIVKMIDFGTSVIVQENSSYIRKIKNSNYTAPEVLKTGSYNEKCDIWSCGVILFILLSGRPPFFARKEEEIVKKVIAGKYSTDGPEWERVSTMALNLLKRMLEPNPKKRITARAALEDSWITYNLSLSAKREQTDPRALKNLQTFRTEQKFQFAVLTFLGSNLLNKEESKQMYDNFRKLDKNNDGKLSADELIEAYNKTMQKEEAEEEVRKIMQTVDSNGSGFIDYSEFVTACMKKEMLVNNESLEIAFKAFDLDGSGKITSNELMEILGVMQGEDEHLTEILKSVDRDGDGLIDLDEFKNMMLSIFS